MTGKSEVNYLLSGTGMQALQGYFKIFLKRAAQVACQQCQKKFWLSLTGEHPLSL